MAVDEERDEMDPPLDVAELADRVEHPGLRCHDRLLPDLGLRAMHLGCGVRCLRFKVWELVFGAWSFGC